MRDLLKAGLRRFAFAWFWALVLLALPNCGLEQGGLCNNNCNPHLNAGDLPRDSAIMCDIEKYQGGTRRCATPQDLVIGIRLASAAEALVSGQASNVGLDYSPAAQTACGAGHPQAIDFRGSFPDGYVVCLNCGQVIPVPHADATAVCVAQCQDLVDNGGAPMPPDVLAFCTANAHPSTHFPSSGCFANACSSGGLPRADFADPRRIPEPVVWTDFIGTAAVGSILFRSGAAPTGTFDAGAVSTQWIHGNDAYVEFEASENNLSHVIGFAQTNGCPFPCTDGDPSIMDINFGISLNFDGHFYLVDGGTLVTATDVNGMAPDVNGSFGTYAAGDRFRVKVTDNFDGTATLTFAKLVGACVPGNPCVEDVFYTHGGSAAYPLRVDASFREPNATLANVSIVRIQ
jgi:hypothetical protein